MGRKRRHAKKSGGGSGGALTRLRGGFRSTVRSATGTGKPRPTTPVRRTVTNLITIALVVVAAVLLLRRFGVLH
jgi:hypothetical protein